MLRHILVAADFSDASEVALQAAGALARRWGARVMALHAETFEPPPYLTGPEDAVRAMRPHPRGE